jgi:hypothetical protein
MMQERMPWQITKFQPSGYTFNDWPRKKIRGIRAWNECKVIYIGGGNKNRRRMKNIFSLK